MTESETLALVGAVGGAGTTRLAVEFAAALARDGRDVAVLDAAYATQGLAQYVEGRIAPDMTALCLDDGSLADGMVDLQLGLPGRVALCPAFAPFERLARAKTPAAARAFEDRVDEAAGWFDHVLVDTPPVAANQAVAATNAADRVALVTPATRRGLDALPRAAGRLVDVGVDDHRVVANRTPGTAGAEVEIQVEGELDIEGEAEVEGELEVEGEAVGESESAVGGRYGVLDGVEVETPDAVVPESPVTAPGDTPAVVEDGDWNGTGIRNGEDGSFAVAVARALEAVLGAELDVTTGEEGLGRYLPG